MCITIFLKFIYNIYKATGLPCTGLPCSMCTFYEHCPTPWLHDNSVPGRQGRPEVVSFLKKKTMVAQEDISHTPNNWLRHSSNISHLIFVIWVFSHNKLMEGVETKWYGLVFKFLVCFLFLFINWFWTGIHRYYISICFVFYYIGNDKEFHFWFGLSDRKHQVFRRIYLSDINFTQQIHFLFRYRWPLNNTVSTKFFKINTCTIRSVVGSLQMWKADNAIL